MYIFAEELTSFKEAYMTLACGFPTIRCKIYVWINLLYVRVFKGINKFVVVALI